MENEGAITEMVHFECRVCSLMATCVNNNPAQLAWLDHMATHAAPAEYDAWTWAVQQFSWSS